MNRTALKQLSGLHNERRASGFEASSRLCSDEEHFGRLISVTAAVYENDGVVQQRVQDDCKRLSHIELTTARLVMLLYTAL